MSLLFKAELRGHSEPMAKAAFVMEDLKKGLSPEVRELFGDYNIGIRDAVFDPPLDSWKAQLGKYPDSIEPMTLTDDAKIPRITTKPKKKDYAKFITNLSKHIDLFDKILNQEDAIKNLPQDMEPKQFDMLLQASGIDKELVEAYKKNKKIFARFQGAKKALTMLIDNLGEKISEESKTLRGTASRQERIKGANPLNVPLRKLLEDYSKDERLEFIRNRISDLNKDFQFFDQQNLTNIWERYDDGELHPSLFAVLNDEFNGEKGIELLKKLAVKLDLSPTYTKDTSYESYIAFESLTSKMKQEIDAIDEIIDDDANIDTTKKIFSDKKYPITRIEGIADNLEIKLYDLEEGDDDPVYSYVPHKDTLEDKAGKIDIDEINEDIRNIEMSRLVNYYSVLYYVADLRGKKLNKKMLNWEGHEIGVETLPDRFPIITDTFNALQEEE